MGKKSKNEPVDLSAEIKSLLPRLGASDGMIVTFIAARCGEGTSTIARSYAKAFGAVSGKKILLIEAAGEDSADPGIVERFAAGADIGDALVEIAPNVFAGRWSTGDAGRMSSGHVIQDKAFWKVLSKTFALIVIDAPALQGSHEGIAFAQAAKQCVLVVEADATRKEVVQNLRDTLTTANVTVAGIVMNKRRYYIPEGRYKRL